MPTINNLFWEGYDMSLKILEFDTQHNHYVFDGITGDVFVADDVMMNCLRMSEAVSGEMLANELRVKNFDEKKINAAMAFVDRMKTVGLYTDRAREQKKWEESICFEESTIQALLKSGHMQQLILNVTEDCNMRCKYCFLSEVYHYTRNRTNQMMSKENAKKALDLFFKYMKTFREFNPGKTMAISFYGGEPLLNFEVIKYAIKYTKENSPLGYKFNITTNGLLLNDEYADFLVENDVAITVSLDGSKENHDRNRVDVGRNGTFDKVFRNMIRFKERHPNYYKYNISCVWDFRTELMRNSEFFREYERLFPLIGNISFVSANGTDYFKQFTEEDIKRYTENFLTFRQQYVDGKIKGERISSFTDLFFSINLMSAILKMGTGDKRLPILPFTSCCVPGFKLSVRPSGVIDMCEKIDGSMAIGDIDYGLDISKISGIIKTYNDIITKDCVDCPINKHCGLCYAQCCQGGEFKKPDCENMKLNFKMNLMIVYTILELNPHAFDTYRYQEEWILNA